MSMKNRNRLHTGQHHGTFWDALPGPKFWLVAAVALTGYAAYITLM